MQHLLCVGLVLALACFSGDVDTLVGQLTDESPSVRRDAAVALGELGPAAKTAVPALLKVANEDRDRSVQKSAVDAIVKIGEDAIPALIDALDKSLAAGGALVGIGPPAVPPLIRTLETNNDRNARWGAANALRMIGAQGDKEVRKQVLQAMVRALKEDEFADVRRMAAQVIGRIGPLSVEDAYPTLLKSVDDDDARVRAGVAASLARIGPPAEVAVVLARMLEDQKVAVRAGALGGLAALGPKAKVAVPVVKEALADRSRRVRIRAAGALWKIDSQAGPALPVLIEVLQDRKTPDRYSQDLLLAIRTLGEFGPEAKAAVPALIELVETKLAAGVLSTTRKAIKMIDPVAAAELGLIGHAGMVTSVAFSPDGTRLASGSADMMIKIWDASTGEELTTLGWHKRGVTSVAFSPDGARLASGSSDTTIKIWDVSTGEALTTLGGHEQGVTSVAFSPDGTRLASASLDTTIRIWDVSTGEALTTLGGHEQGVTSVAFSPDGSLLLSCSSGMGGAIGVWDVSTGKAVAILREREPLGCVRFSPDGRRVAAGSMESVRIWETSVLAQSTSASRHKRFAYIYYRDELSAKSFEQFLEGEGLNTDLVSLDEAQTTDFSSYTAIIIGSETRGFWTDSAAKTIDDSKKPIMGLGEGGSQFFDKLKLLIGASHGWHGRETTVIAVDSPQSEFWSSAQVVVPQNKKLKLYKSTRHVGIYVQTPGDGIVLIGREEKSGTHYPVVQQGPRYILWGFWGGPDDMTRVGRSLFAHTCRYVESLTKKSKTSPQ